MPSRSPQPALLRGYADGIHNRSVALTPDFPGRHLYQTTTSFRGVLHTSHPRAVPSFLLMLEPRPGAGSSLLPSIPNAVHAAQQPAAAAVAATRVAPQPGD